MQSLTRLQLINYFIKLCSKVFPVGVLQHSVTPSGPKWRCAGTSGNAANPLRCRRCPFLPFYPNKSKFYQYQSSLPGSTQRPVRTKGEHRKSKEPTSHHDLHPRDGFQSDRRCSFRTRRLLARCRPPRLRVRTRTWPLPSLHRTVLPIRTPRQYRAPSHGSGVCDSHLHRQAVP